LFSLELLSSFILPILFKIGTMNCPCGLTKAEVLEVAEKHDVPLVGGKCQNPKADGTDGVCGKALGAHPLAQGSKLASSAN
jgi:hypothetical protein